MKAPVFAAHTGVRYARICAAVSLCLFFFFFFFLYKGLRIVLVLDTLLAEANKRGPTKD